MYLNKLPGDKTLSLINFNFGIVIEPYFYAFAFLSHWS